MNDLVLLVPSHHDLSCLVLPYPTLLLPKRGECVEYALQGTCEAGK